MTSSANPVLLSSTDRRNSKIEIWSSDEKVWLRKTYHAKYNVHEEALAYESFDRLLANLPGVRTAKVYGYDESANSLDMEYVAGSTLAEALARRGYHLLGNLREPLLELLALSHKHELPCDCDPTNLILPNETTEDDSAEIVLIDPICVDLPLQHFSAVVFLWGLLKSFVAQCYRLDRWPGFFRNWRAIKTGYLAKTACPSYQINAEISQYIATVIRWNIQESAKEHFLKRVFRWTILIPMWTAFRAWFSLAGSLLKSISS